MARLSQRLNQPGQPLPRHTSASRLSATATVPKRALPKQTVPKPAALKQTLRKRSVRPRRSRRGGKALLAGGSMAFLAALTVVPAKLKPSATEVAPQPICQEVVRSEARLSREQLSRLLSIPEAASKEAIQRIVDTPYCILKSAKAVHHAAYPLEFDPNTWLVLVYEDGAYRDYDFVFK
ncbi:MAG: hypothetical protein AAGC54_14875 [Cyanobacteria bacterium P01_F01_bin.4]